MTESLLDKITRLLDMYERKEITWIEFKAALKTLVSVI
jgi:hypothetical protein